MGIFRRRVDRPHTATIGDVIAESLADHPERWSRDGDSCLCYYTHTTEGWLIKAFRTYAGDSMDCDIPLTGRERRRIWRGLDNLDAYITNEKRANALRAHYGNASAMSAGTAETPQEAQGEARQRDGDSRDAQTPPPSPRSAASVQQTAAKNHGD